METRVFRGQLHETVKRIERDGLVRIMSIVPDGNEYVLTLESKSQPKRETR